MELKERPVVSQLQVVRERIRAIRKILNQSEKLRKSKPEENYSSNNEQCEDDDETAYQAQKSLRELIETLNSGKEDKYTKGMINDYSDDEYNNEYSTDDFSQFESKQKKRQLATISVQKAAFHYKTPRSHNAPTKKSTKRSNKKDFLNQNDYSYNDSNPGDDSIAYNNRANRIFGLNNKRQRDYKLDYNYNDADTTEYSDYSSSYVYCPICSHKIHKRSKSPRGCNHHQKNRKRNASASRKYENRCFQILSEPTTSDSRLSDNYSTYDELVSYDDVQNSSKQKQHGKRAVKNLSRNETISSYYTDTSTLLNRYGSSPSISLYSSYNLELSESDVEDYSCIDDDDDIDVDEILRNLEKRKRYFTSMNDPYVNSLTKAWKTKDDRKSKRNKKENCVSSRNTISIKPRYKFEDSISSSCSVLSELLDEMSEEEKKYNMDNEIVHSSKRTKTKAKNQENELNERKRKQKQKSSSSYSSRNENAQKLNSEDEEEIKFNLGDKELDQILIKPITKKKDDVNNAKKVQHTVKFILEEEEEDIQNAKSNSSNNSINDKNKPNSILMNGHEEEDLTEDVIFNSNIIMDSKQKINVEEESLLELSSENSTEKVIYMQKFKQKQKDYSIEEEEEEISFEEEIHKFTTPVIKSKEEEEVSFEETPKFTASVSKEEESLFETKNKSIHDLHHKKQTTSSSLYNDVDDIDIDIFDDDEESHENNNQVRSKNNQASEEESLYMEMHQAPVVEEEEEDEIMMINHLKDDNEEESEEENMPEKHHSENENLSNIEEEILSNDNIEFDNEN